MGNVIDIFFEGTPVGSITFEEAPRDLPGLRTATGFALGLPFTVRLKMAGSREPQPLFSGLSARLLAPAGGADIQYLGRADCDEYFLGSVPEPASKGNLLWSDSLRALALYEEIRGGKQPQMKMEVRPEVCYLVPYPEGGVSRPLPGRQLRTSPFQVSGTVDLSYPTEVWVSMLRQLRVMDYVLVQVPLRSDPPAGWDAVWRELIHGRDAFEQGGTTGWTACVVAVRRALEAWDAIDPVRMWPGWQGPSEEQRREWAKSDRLLGLRWHLRQAAHPAAHAGPDGWSREDARLMLSTLSALLAVRAP